ncbi:MAG: prepilin-type N-terminal cleavage/methylation domain-containing protein, partial [Candidatus Eisenbacteria bacterium]
MTRGFTLVELVVVMVLIAVVVAVSYVKLADHDEMKLHGASRKIISDVRYAQSLALARRTRAGVTFNISDNNYSVFLGSAGN